MVSWNFEYRNLVVGSHLDDERAKCRVAASVGPYGAVLSDGSEFNGWYTDSMTIEVVA